MEMYHHQDTKYGVKRKQPETSRHSVLYHRLKHTDNMEKIKKKTFSSAKANLLFYKEGVAFRGHSPPIWFLFPGA